MNESDSPVPDYESINIMMWRFRDLNRRLANVTSESLRLLVAAVEARDPYTKHHSVRVASFARYLATELGLPERQVRTIHSAALLHDIGKIGIPDAILTKPSRLTEQETELIRQHPLIGVNILEQARFFVAELPLVKHHHEWFNGNGYPDKIMGQDIPLGARIIHIADATEAMLARRSYKKPYELEHTVRQVRDGAGRQFDGMITDVAIKLMRDGVLERLWKYASGAEEELNLVSSS
jgi:putative nucleotidyltransferase with HDIG domain